MFAHKHLAKLAGYSNAEAFSVMQSKRNMLRTGVYIGTYRFYGLADVARAILLSRLRDLDIRESIGVKMIDQLEPGELESAAEAFARGTPPKLVVSFMRSEKGVTAQVNAKPQQASTTLIFDLTKELLAALETQELSA